MSFCSTYVSHFCKDEGLVLTARQIDAIERPTFKDTAIFRLPAFAYRKTIGRFLNPAQVKAEELGEDDAETLEEAALNEATSINANEESERRKPKVRRR